MEETSGGAVFHLPHQRRRISAAWRNGDSVSDARRWTCAGGGRCRASMAKRPSKVGALVFALKMDWWKMAVMTHESASDRFVLQTQYVAWLEPQALDVRHLCDVYLLLGSDYRHPFIKWIGVGKDVVKMVASDYLMYYFVRSS